MKPDKYDFGGYATRNDIRCSDGRVIRQDAFKHDDGRVVPLIWHHGSSNPGNILGHAILENRTDGVYVYGVFNNSTNADNAKDLVKHSAINALSIHAHKLGQVGKDVLSGAIKEVSLVMSGANPGAYIDTLAFSHGEFDEELVDEAIIYSGETLSHSMEEVPVEVPEPVVVPEVVPEIVHAESESTVGDILATLSEKQVRAVGFLLDELMGGSDISEAADAKHADDDEEDGDEETVGDVLKTLDENQQAAVGYLIAELEKENDEDDASAEHSEMESGYMKTNVFDQNQSEQEPLQTLTHDDFAEITELARRRGGSFKDAFFEHLEENDLEFTHAPTGTYGMDNIGLLFPDARTVTPTPEFIRRDNTWVGVVMTGTRKTPFARIKSMAADITPDEARAKGYVTGNEKVNEVFELLGRATSPTTVYKKQKLDRDDIIDITDFDVIVWLRSEMRLMLDEEIARAILIGDGRDPVSNDKIKEDCIRPIYTDAALYAHRVELQETTADKIIDEVVRAKQYYKGSGSPTLFTSPAAVTDMLLVKDTLGRRLYATIDELAAALRVSRIVEVESMAGVVHSTTDAELFGIIVNLSDYTIGADKGGEVNAFDDFDINFNQYHYLIETRISGALTKPKAALVLEKKVVVVG